MEESKDWYIDVGKELVTLGIKPMLGMHIISNDTGETHQILGECWDKWLHNVPDCRDRLTRKMIEMHIEDVAREFYGDLFREITFTIGNDGEGEVTVYDTALHVIFETAGSLPRSYINALRKMRKKGPYDLKTNPGDLFVVHAQDLCLGSPDPVTAGLVALGGDLVILLEARKVREDDIWECYPIIPAPEGFADLGLEGSWLAMLQTDGEVQTRMESEMTKRWTADL